MTDGGAVQKLVRAVEEERLRQREQLAACADVSADAYQPSDAALLGETVGVGEDVNGKKGYTTYTGDNAASR